MAAIPADVCIDILKEIAIHVEAKGLIYDALAMAIDCVEKAEKSEPVIHCEECDFYNGEYKVCANRLGMVQARPEKFCSYGRKA